MIAHTFGLQSNTPIWKCARGATMSAWSQGPQCARWSITTHMAVAVVAHDCTTPTPHLQLPCHTVCMVVSMYANVSLSVERLLGTSITVARALWSVYSERVLRSPVLCGTFIRNVYYCRPRSAERLFGRCIGPRSVERFVGTFILVQARRRQGQEQQQQEWL